MCNNMVTEATGVTSSVCVEVFLWFGSEAFIKGKPNNRMTDTLEHVAEPER